jgi:phosphate transport system substrate-binding protein
MSVRHRAGGCLLILALLIGVTGVTSRGEAGLVTITGAGSSFDYPLFSAMFAAYHRRHPDIQVNYQSVGSGAGQQQLFAGTIDFGASDAPLTDEQMREHPTILHIPITVGAVAIGYNLPGGGPPVRLTGDMLARIYLGEIKEWTYPAIARVNPGRPFPPLPIIPVHRSDGSGTSFIVTSYLSAVSAPWRERVGRGLSVAWPTGVGAKGSEGVSGQVRTTPGAVGYFEMAYALQNHIPMAALLNAAGHWVTPTVAGASAGAAQAAAHMPGDLRALFVNAPGPITYPIAGFSWVLIDTRRVSPVLIDLLTYMIHEGQRFAAPLGYAPLPAPVVRLIEGKLRSIRASKATPRE